MRWHNQYNMVEVTLCQFGGPGLKKLATSASYLLGYWLSKPSLHAVRKTKLPCGEELPAGTI